MATKNTTRVSVTLTSVLLLLSIVGCQKNSYQSCVDIQTEAAIRGYKSETAHSTLQEYIDSHVSIYCRGIN